MKKAAKNVLDVILTILHNNGVIINLKNGYANDQLIHQMII